MTPRSVRCTFLRDTRNTPAEFERRCPSHVLPRTEGEERERERSPRPRSAGAGSSGEALRRPRSPGEETRPREGPRLLSCRGRTGVQVFLASQQATSLPLDCALSFQTRGRGTPKEQRPRSQCRPPGGPELGLRHRRRGTRGTRGHGHNPERLPAHNPRSVRGAGPPALGPEATLRLPPLPGPRGHGGPNAMCKLKSGLGPRPPESRLSCLPLKPARWRSTTFTLSHQRNHRTS